MADPTGPADDRRVSLIAQDVHVTYRTYGGRRRACVEDSSDQPWAPLLNRLNRHVGAVTQVHAVRGVSFVAHHGESIGVIGRNGSGKSTLLRAVAGLLPISAGQVYARGEVSLLGVSAALVPRLTGARNVILGGRAQGLTTAQARERFEEVVEFAGVGDFIDMPMSSYSSGMAARLRFAIAAAHSPDVLIIDEALATGDVEFRARATERIRRVREEAGTVFLVSHFAKTIRDTCDRVLWMEHGELIADGDTDTVLAACRKKYPPAPKKR